MNLPPNVAFLDESRNHFNGIALIDSRTRSEFGFKDSGVE